MGLHAHVGGGPGGIGGKELGDIGLLAAVQAGLVARRGFPHHQLGGAHLRIGARDRELHALILADRAAEHLALLRIGRSLGDEPLGIADAFGRDQDPLGIHAAENVAEAFAFLADQVRLRHPQVVEEQRRGGVVHHGADRIDADAGALREPHVDQKDRKPLRALLRRLAWRRAGEQQEEIGMLGAGGPDLLAVDDVVVALAHRGGAQVERVGARGRFGDAEGLQAQIA